jgi:hypothetical protein
LLTLVSARLRYTLAVPPCASIHMARRYAEVGRRAH